VKRFVMAKYSKEDKENFNYKFINDPIYGSIGLSKLETDLINTPAFQRLRHLKQLGFASYVFPGGEHSRFVHSLGVLYIMGKMCEQLEANELASPSKPPLFSRRRDTVKLRVAALLHDIGHYPLSHLGEAVYCYEAYQTETKETNKHEIYETFKEEVIEEENGQEQRPLLFDMSKKWGKAAHHEKLGLIVVTHNNEIRSILENANLNPNEIGDIFTRSAQSPENMLYYNMLHSSLDADRLDYLLRDSAQTGVNFGMVDLDYLIRLMVVRRIPFKKESSARIIAFNKKGQHVIEHFLMCRYFHYAQVVTHRTSSAFEAVAKVVFYKMLKDKAFIPSSYSQLFKVTADGQWFVNSPGFLKFTDDEWWHAAGVHYENTEDNTYRLFYEALLKRIPPRSIYYTRDVFSYSRKLTFTSENKEEYFIRKRNIHKKLPCIASSLGLDPNRLGCYFGESDIEKDSYKVKSETLDLNDDEMMDCIKLFDRYNQRITLLSKDETSMVAQIADLYTESINVFYIPERDECIDEAATIRALREALNE